MLKGQGLLSLWNGVDPERWDEYNLWHAREHVPERLAVPGIMRARRYHRGNGPLPEFLTLYELASNAVLNSAPYRALLENPTPWSQSMRPSFRGFFRVGHLAVSSQGGGVGSALMATTFDEVSVPEGFWEELAGRVLRETAATAIHVLKKDPSVAPVPFTVPSAGEAAYADGGAIMIECYDRSRLDDIARMLDPALDAQGLVPARAAWTGYDLAYLLDREERTLVVAASRPEV